MFGRGMHRNPYGNGPPFSPREQGFKSPRPMYHSSPVPRFHQQTVPHYTSPPHLNRSPNSSQQFTPSPNRSHNSSYNSSNSQSFNRSFGSNRSHFTSPGNYRGNSFGRNKSGPQYQNFSRNNADCNPGGSADPNDYYHPSMSRDPWQSMNPVSVSQSGPTTT